MSSMLSNDDALAIFISNHKRYKPGGEDDPRSPWFIAEEFLQLVCELRQQLVDEGGDIPVALRNYALERGW